VPRYACRSPLGLSPSSWSRPGIGTQHRLIVALPARHRERAHAVGARVAEGHRLTGRWTYAHADPRRAPRRGRNWVPLTSALAPTRPEQKKQGGAAPVIANWHSSHYHRRLSHRRSTLVIKSFPPADARTIVPTRSAVTSRTLGGDTGSGRGRWGSGLVVIAVPLVQRQSVTLHCGVRTKTQPP
jgi:hypothetical protein